MKRFMVFLATAAASIACSQLPEQPILDAYTNLSTESVWVQMKGSEVTAKGTNLIETDFYWYNDTSTPNLQNKAAMVVYRNGAMVQRVVGDGQTLWTYDLVRHEYSESIYGYYNGGQTASSQQRLLDLLFVTAKGQSSYVARLAREIFAPGSIAYRSWMPGYAAIPLTGQYTDPLESDFVFVVTPTVEVVNFGRTLQSSLAQAPAQVRSLTFEYATTPNTNDPWRLRVSFADQSTAGRKVAWRMTVYPSYAPSKGQDTFTPYTPAQIGGWMPVSGPRPELGQARPSGG